MTPTEPEAKGKGKPMTKDESAEERRLRCPQCGSKLYPVVNPSGSMLNDEQFDSGKAGEYYCTSCKSDKAKTGYKYFRESDLPSAAPPEPEKGLKRVRFRNMAPDGGEPIYVTDDKQFDLTGEFYPCRMIDARIAELRERLLERESIEASVCPEDVGIVEYVRSLERQLAEATAKAEAAEKKVVKCEGKPHAANPNDCSHESQIEGLHNILGNARITFTCASCGFQLNGPYTKEPFSCVRCTVGDMQTPWDSEIAELRSQLAELDASESGIMDELDRAQEAFQDTHIALGGDGEWCAKLPPMPPPDSGDLYLDVPVLAATLRQSLAEATAKAEEAAVENKKLKYANRTRDDYNLICERCGKAHNLDTSIPSEIWNQIAHPENVYCTLCIDELLTEVGLTAEAEFYFVGDALRSKMYAGSHGKVAALRSEVSHLTAAASRAREHALEEAARVAEGYIPGVGIMRYPGDEACELASREISSAIRALLTKEEGK